jgi:hypothetical protein
VPPGFADNVYCGIKVPPVVTKVVPLTIKDTNSDAENILGVTTIGVATELEIVVTAVFTVFDAVFDTAMALYNILFKVAEPPKDNDIECGVVPAVFCNRAIISNS